MFDLFDRCYAALVQGQRAAAAGAPRTTNPERAPAERAAWFRGWSRQAAG